MKPFAIVLFSLLILLSGSCEKEAGKEPSDNLFTLDRSNFTFIKSEEIFNKARLSRSVNYSAPFDIIKIEKIKEIINITVSFTSGCKGKEFFIIWDGLIMESYPEMIRLYIKRSSDCPAASGEVKTITMTVNLAEFLGDKALAERASVFISDASKAAGSNNADLSVSDKN